MLTQEDDVEIHASRAWLDQVRDPPAHGPGPQDHRKYLAGRRPRRERRRAVWSRSGLYRSEVRR